MSDIKSIGIIGSGKAANFFAKLFCNGGYRIAFIAGRNYQTGDKLAHEVNTVYHKISDELPACDLLLFAVNDDSISELAKLIQVNETIVAHCAGSVSIDVLKTFKHSAVIYPLQSLNEHTMAIDVPLLIEGSSNDIELRLEHLMGILNLKYRLVASDKRIQYHLAAVFANNFSNAILSATNDISRNYNLEFDLLKPLIASTYKKVIEGANPHEVQTGPAIRGDISTLDKHNKMLEQSEQLKSLYQAISAYITERSKAQ